MDPGSIFQTDIDEALQRVELSLFILASFRWVNIFMFIRFFDIRSL